MLLIENLQFLPNHYETWPELATLDDWVKSWIFFNNSIFLGQSNFHALVSILKQGFLDLWRPYNSAQGIYKNVEGEQWFKVLFWIKLFYVLTLVKKVSVQIGCWNSGSMTPKNCDIFAKIGRIWLVRPLI